MSDQEKTDTVNGSITDIKRVKSFVQNLPHELTDRELMDYGIKLANSISLYRAEIESQTSIKSAMKTRLNKMELEQSEFTTIVNARTDFRDVEVEATLFFSEDVYREVRVDTGEVTFERSIYPNERQEDLKITITGDESDESEEPDETEKKIKKLSKKIDESLSKTESKKDSKPEKTEKDESKKEF